MSLNSTSAKSRRDPRISLARLGQFRFGTLHRRCLSKGPVYISLVPTECALTFARQLSSRFIVGTILGKERMDIMY